LNLALSGVSLLHDGGLPSDEFALQDIDQSCRMIVIVEPRARMLQFLREACYLSRILREKLAAYTLRTWEPLLGGWQHVVSHSERTSELAMHLGSLKHLFETWLEAHSDLVECWHGDSSCVKPNCCAVTRSEAPSRRGDRQTHSTRCEPRDELDKELLDAWSEFSKTLSASRRERSRYGYICSRNRRGLFERSLRARRWVYRGCRIRGTKPTETIALYSVTPVGESCNKRRKVNLLGSAHAGDHQWDLRVEHCCVPCVLRYLKPDLLSIKLSGGWRCKRPELMMEKSCQCSPHGENDWWYDDAYDWEDRGYGIGITNFWRQSRQSQRYADESRKARSQCRRHFSYPSSQGFEAMLVHQRFTPNKRQARSGRCKPRGGRCKPRESLVNMSDWRD
jgi:hypothetical protein